MERKWNEREKTIKAIKSEALVKFEKKLAIKFEKARAKQCQKDLLELVIRGKERTPLKMKEADRLNRSVEEEPRKSLLHEGSPN